MADSSFKTKFCIMKSAGAYYALSNHMTQNLVLNEVTMEIGGEKVWGHHQAVSYPLDCPLALFSKNLRQTTSPSP